MFFQFYMITSLVYNDIWLTLIINSDALITVTKCDTDSIALYSYIFKDKGCKITVKFKLDKPRSKLVFSTKHESQLEIIT